MRVLGVLVINMFISEGIFGVIKKSKELVESIFDSYLFL